MSLDFDDRDRDSVVQDLASDDPEVRRLAVERVAALPTDGAIPLLVERLGDESWRVRKAAVERLVQCPDGSRVTAALVGALGDGENPGRRNAAVEALVRCGSRVVPGLVDATSSDDPDVRKLVVDALAGIGDGGALDRLIELLADSDPNVRAATADALGAIGGDRVAEALLGVAVREDEDQLVRFSALHALGALEAPVGACDVASVLDDPVLLPAGLDLLGREDDPDAVAVLLKGLASGSRSSREAAMRSLLRLLSHVDGGRAAALADEIRRAVAACDSLVPDAIDRLGNADVSSRLVIVQFLGLLGCDEAVVPILLAGHDEVLSQVALATLDRMGEVAERAIDAGWSELDGDARRDACALLGNSTGERSAARLLTALDDVYPEIRAAAARSIGRRRLGEALPTLVRRLEEAAVDEDFESEEEMLALTEALVEVARPRPGEDDGATAAAVDLLRSRLDGAVETMRLAVATVFGCIGRHEDVDLVTFLLKDPSALVRRAAVDALARLDPGTAAEPLRLALADEAATVRIAAAAALGASEQHEVIHDLESLADDEDPRVRAAAVQAVTLRFAGSDAEEPRARALDLLDRALADDALVALAAVEVLREMGGDVAARAVSVLDRAEPELVKEAVGCISSHGDDATLEALLPLVAHPDWSVRAEAIQSLAERGMARAVPPILRRLETEQDEFVRDAILRALRRLEG